MSFFLCLRWQSAGCIADCAVISSIHVSPRLHAPRENTATIPPLVSSFPIFSYHQKHWRLIIKRSFRYRHRSHDDSGPPRWWPFDVTVGSRTHVVSPWVTLQGSRRLGARAPTSASHMTCIYKKKGTSGMLTVVVGWEEGKWVWYLGEEPKGREKVWAGGGHEGWGESVGESEWRSGHVGHLCDVAQTDASCYRELL